MEVSMSENMNATNKKSKTSSKGKHGQTSKPIYKKYDRVMEYGRDPEKKLKPSDMAKSAINVSGDDYPMIIELVNILDNTSQIHSTVDIDEPLFVPAPNIVIFEDYAPFAVHEKKLFFRNKDSIARRVKIFSPDSPFFEVSAPRASNGDHLKQSKIAAGMEVMFIVKFKAQEVRDYSYDLICSTEREKFLVPIRAIGNRPNVTFPDDLAFGSVPVKSSSTKMMFVQNIGRSTAKFSLKTRDNIFTCRSEEFIMEAGVSQMIEVTFTPSAAHHFVGEVEVEFFRGASCFIKVEGSGRNVDVALSTPSLAVDACYISLLSQKTLRIINHSDSPISFAWRSFANAGEEDAEKQRLLTEINRMEDIEMTNFITSVKRDNGWGTDGDFGTDRDDDSIGDEADGTKLGISSVLPLSAKAAEAAIIRKYRNLRVALEKDPMSFVDDIFEISPIEGQVWSDSEMEINVTFRPDTAALFTCLAYLDVSGREDRLNLHLNGQGIGPRASLSYDVLDTGDVFINDDQEYQVTLTNKGDILAKWSFLSSLTKFGSKFKFTPSEGDLEPGESVVINIKFTSDILGEFSEHFRFALQGNEDMILFQVKGHVIGPTFHMDCSAIDFGMVSFDYLHTATTRLVNSSKIPMMYNIHIPQDGTHSRQEFEVTPKEGVLVPGEFVDVTVEFTPQQVKVYDYSLAVDVLGVGEMLLSTPLKAECIVEPVTIAKREVSYGDCFLLYPYTEEFLLINSSQSVYTKFEIQDQNEASKVLGVFKAEPSVGFIEPGGSLVVKMHMTPYKLGQSKVPVSLTVGGSLEPPQQAFLVFNCIGPRILLDQREIKWGSIECLKDEKRTILITNDSPICAELFFFLKSAKSRFDLPLREAVLQANEELIFEVKANVDDTIVHKEELHIMVTNSINLMVPLSAKGIGTTMYCKQDIQVIDFGPQLTDVKFERRITLENKGRRAQQLRWYNETLKLENLNRLAKVKSLKQAPSTLPKHLAPSEGSFSVHPEEITLRPRTATTFIFKGASGTPGPITELFVLESKVGKDRNMVPIIKTEVKAEIQAPLLDCDVRELNFLYEWGPNKAPTVSKKEITLTNKTAVTLGCIFKTEIPFNLSAFDHVLEPNETLVMDVEFDPRYRDDKTSSVIEKAISVSYRGHNQKDSIKLNGEVVFPNLKFETNTINFGAILNETEKRVKCKVTNCCKAVCSYSWVFMENDVPNKPVPKGKGHKKHLELGTKTELSTGTVPANEAFDVLPIRSVLEPGESEDVEFVLFGHTNSKFNCFAICEVEGGPEYKLTLIGESSTVAYSLDTSYLDFGRVVYTEIEERELALINKGRVPYKWSVNRDNLSSPGLFEFVPSEGMVQPNEEMKITVRFRPGIPNKFAETVFINVAHFDPAKITLYGEGKFPVATITLPRYRFKGPLGEKENVKSMWETFVQTATNNIINPDPAFIAPLSVEEAPPIPFGDSSIPIEFEPTPRIELIDDQDGSKVEENDRNTLSESKISKPKQEALDVEMTRMAFSVLLGNAIDAARKELIETDAISVPSTESGTLSNQALIAKCIDVTTIYTANYLCDFGNVLAGTTRKKVFKITNSSEAGVMSWSFDNVAAGREGFNLDPDAVVKLPEGSSQDFTVKFSTRNQKPGKKKYVLNVCIKGTGTILVTLMANICIPDVEISHAALDFERVYVGRSKKMFFRIHNTTPVKAVWNLKPAQGSKDESRFVFFPSSGVLRSGKKTIISCEFMPVEGRLHTLDAILKMDMNNKPKIINVSAEALSTPLKFEPTFLEQGPILPFSSTGDEKIVTVVSNCEIPVELYSLDFDTQYKIEEDMLATVADIMFDNDGCLRVPVRDAGCDLDDSIQKVYTEATYVPPEPEPEPEPVVPVEGENGEANEETERNEENVPLEGDAQAIESVEIEKVVFPPPPLRSSSCPRDEELHQDIIVVAPPVCGSSSVCSFLSKKLVLPFMTVDGLIKEIADTDSDYGYRARRTTKTLTAEEAANIGEKEEMLKNAAEASKEAATTAYMAANKKAKDVPNEVLETPEVVEYTTFLSQSNADSDFVAAMVSHRLSWVDAGHGVIIDGVVSVHLEETAVVQGLKQALPKAVVCNLNLYGEETTFLNRIQGVYESSLVEEKRLDRTLYQARLKLSQPKKSKKDRKSSSVAMETVPTINPDSIVFPESIPEGDEPWIDQVTGSIIELDAQDIRALDENQRVEYNNQLLWYQQERLRNTRSVLKSILAIWKPETNELITGVKSDAGDSENTVENGENETGATETSDSPSPEMDTTIDAEPDGTNNVDGVVVSENVEKQEEATDQENIVYTGPEKKIVLYNKYIDEILPCVKDAFADPPPIEEPVTENEEGGQSADVASAPEETGEEGESAVENNETQNTADLGPKSREFGIFEITVGVNDLEDAVNQSVLALIPAAKVPPFDKDAIPSTIESQLIRRPYPRVERKTVNNFEILEYNPEPAGGEEGKDATTVPASEGEDEVTKDPLKPSRWIVPPFGQVQFKVRFTSETEGKFDNVLMFEAMGSKQEFSLFCSGRCELPKVNGDSRIVFSKRARSVIPGAPLPIKRFVIAENYFSFGPILSFKHPDWRMAPPEDADETTIANNALVTTTNCDKFRLTNTGSYPCDVDMSMLNLDENPIFFIDDPKITLEEGETKEVTVWAFPQEAETYKNSLVATISDNPEPLRFDLVCSGVVPTITLNGPWEEAIAAQLVEAEAALEEANSQPKPDKKAIEALNNKIEILKAGGDGALPIPFDRILIGKTDRRSFELTNSSDLPVVYVIDPEDFNDSENITFSPLGGTLNPGQAITIDINFSSEEPLVLDGKFSLRYSDVEGGIDVAERTFTKQFHVTCEAYKITTVSLTAEGEESGGNAVDYGTLRVGDYAHKIVKMVNKGKYKIAYKIGSKRPTTSELLTLTPSEGEIEPDETVDIEVIFCSKDSKVELVNNKDIRVAISEPITGEVVEEFPIYISANAVFAKYRMQPAKGIQFGAVRFDSKPSTKRVELRNEGKYEFTYVVTPVSSEVSELDALDGAAFACYAYSLPAATRQAELGEGYVEKAVGGDNAAAKGKPAKGAPASVATGSAWNAFVKDPDDLHPHPLPDDPLVVGAFTVVQRCGSVAPGETTGFDIKFDPSGCASAHERLRIFIAGADYSETTTLFLKNFDISGDSCIPSIVDDDMQGIFEEQEVVDQLSEAGASLEKLPVGKVVFAVQENMLAFGPMACNQTSSKGQVERVKITNPTKIDCKVKFFVSGQETAAAVAVDSKAKKGKGDPPPGEGLGPPQAFTVHPESWDIPPHEYRFVNVYFNPVEIKTYRSVFNAEVDTAGLEAVTNTNVDAANKGQKLSFELAGSGTLPCISVEEPTARDENGVLLDFKRVHVNKSSRREIVLRNDGVMPSVCLFDIKSERLADFSFPFNGSSVTIAPGGKEVINLSFCPQEIGGELSDDRSADVKISVLNNPYDTYNIHIIGTTYARDAVLDTEEIPGTTATSNEDASSEEMVKFDEINLALGPDQKVSKSIYLRSRANYPLKFDCVPTESCQNMISFSPSYGHIGPHSSKEIILTFRASEPVKLDEAFIQCTLSRIEYDDLPVLEDGSPSNEDLSLRGRWDNSMKSLRPATDKDLEMIAAAAKELEDYQALKAAEEAKGKKGKDPGPPPPPCMLHEAPDAEDGTKMLNETLPEPTFTVVEDSSPQVLNMKCACVADTAKYSCDAGQYITFIPTYMFQNTIHKFNFTNESDISLPLQWTFDENARRRGTRAGTATGGSRGGLASRGGTAPTASSCPFSIEPSFCEVAPKSTKEFTIKFLPLDSGDFEYVMKGETAMLPLSADEQAGPIRIGVYGTGNRPVCHFEVVETPEYLNHRLSTLKNENGVYSPIETGNLRVVELESIGLKTRNTFRFHVINPTGENYDFSWETMGDPSPSWRCVQSSGMLFAGKRVEMVFEYLPEDSAIAESFFRFKLPKVGLDQLFLFAGKVSEPRVAFSTSRLDFHSVMLGDLGSSETIYLENQEHLPFNFVFDKMSLAQLESPDGAILDIQPKSGMVAPHGRFPIVFTFRPKEEILYNVQIICEIKRKPNKLQINIKGEGYGIHPVITTEIVDNTGMRTINLKPAPTMNYLDFGAVQVLDAMTKKINVLNNGKFNFDYLWDSEALNPMVALAGGRMGGTLHKGETMEYNLTFAPQRETSLDGSMVSFTVAGKYTYNISTRGSGVHPALKFSFMHHDFGPCFVTSPGGLTVVEDTVLKLTNNDPSNNISIECGFQKTRTLWVDCPPTVLEPGMVLEVPIHFAPRDVKDYAFVLPFVINGTGKANVNIVGKGISARLELANQSQRRVNFGTMSVGSSVSKSICLVNRSKKALTFRLIDEGKYGTGALEERCVDFMPKSEVTIAPGTKAAVNIQLTFHPTRRVNQFVEDLYIKYAGVTKKLLNVAGKAEGIELGLDTDSLPFGTVVEKSQKVKKLKLENTGDIPITYNWMEATFGPHFSISPLSGKVTPGMDVNFNVTFKPTHVDSDISQDNMLLAVEGYPPLSVTCSGVCIPQPDDSVQTLSFESLARKAEIKSVKLSNPTDKDWFISPSLRGDHWKVPLETKIPARGSADLSITYFPLTMTSEEEHIGQLFIPLPDGSAQLYNLQGKASPPECSSVLTVEAVAKKPVMVTARLENWLNETQKFTTSIEMLEQPSPACFLVAANAVEVGPNGMKEFHMRFSSYVEGTAKTRITFTNPNTGEYCFYDVHATITGTEVLEEVIIEAPVRQSARYIMSADNPLPRDAVISMGNNGNVNEWYTCDCKTIRVNEIHGFSGYSEGSFEIEYRPLVPTKGPEEYLLTIHSTELGAFKYRLKVTATPPSSRQSLTFDVPLGTQQTENFKFKVFNDVNTAFKCAVTKSDVFSVPATLSANAIKSWDGEEMVLGVTFEPTEIGKVSDILTVTSEEGGEYTCELSATCNPPLPQGPFAFSKGSSVDIPFRNCFPAQASWAFQVDSPLFQIKSSTASVGPKAAGSVTVVFEPTLETPVGVVSAKLFVRCESKPELPPWVFYLKGKIEEIDANAAPAGVSGKKK